MKIILLLASTILVVSCITDIDRVIANYNVDMYLSGKLDTMDISTLSQLNDSATEPILKLYRSTDGNIKTEAQTELNRRLCSHFDIEIDQNKNNMFTRNKNNVLSLNLTEERAIALLYENRDEFFTPIKEFN